MAPRAAGWPKPSSARSDRHKAMAFDRILQGAARRTLSTAIAMAARTRSPALVGGLLGLGVRDLADGQGANVLRLLTLPKGGFMEDVGAAFGDGDFAVLGLARNHTKALYGGFLPSWVDDNSYKSAPSEMDARKERLRAFWTKAWPRVQAKARASAVLTGNFSYAAEQEFGTVVEASGTPFIAMHKEALKTPGLVDFFTTLDRDRPSHSRAEKFSSTTLSNGVFKSMPGSSRPTAYKCAGCRAWTASTSGGPGCPIGGSRRSTHGLIFVFPSENRSASGSSQTGCPRRPPRGVGGWAWRCLMA